MSNFVCSMLSLTAFGSIGATHAVPPSTLEPLAIGFAEGFVSDGPEVSVCGLQALSEGVNLKDSLKDLRKGIVTLNVTEIEHAFSEFKDVVAGISTTENACKPVITDVEAIIEYLRQMKGPKDLIIHIISHLFDDSEKIFGELAAAMHAYKTGSDFMTAGRQMGMSVRRMLVGEGNVGPAPGPAPPGARREVFEGMLIGFISDNLEFLDCRREVHGETQHLARAVHDFEDGLRHFNFTELKDAIDEVELFVKGEASTKTTCKTAVVAVENDVKTIISALKSIHGVKDLVAKIIDDVFVHGEDIFGELSAAGKAYGLADYLGSGRQLGMAFRRLLVGGPPAPMQVLV